MLDQIKGLHHVTSLASSAQGNNAFFTGPLGLRRVKKTVNFDAPDVYHLYYGDETGTPGSVMTYFPFPHAARTPKGTGEVGTTAFAVPKGSLASWGTRLGDLGTKTKTETRLGETWLLFHGPDGDEFALVETDDARDGWTGNGVSEGMAIKGFHGAHMRLKDKGGTAELLRFMGYEEEATDGDLTRFRVVGGNDANVIDIQTLPDVRQAAQGAGSVHHIAFAVENRARQLEVREALIDAGMAVTPVIDRDYFWAIYFRAPGGVLFEVATNEPGFDVDEDTAHLGQALKLPSQHAHLRQAIEAHLPKIED